MKVLSSLPTQQQPAASCQQWCSQLPVQRHVWHCPSSALPCPALPFVIIHLFYFVAKPFASHAVCKGCSLPNTVFPSLPVQSI